MVYLLYEPLPAQIVPDQPATVGRTLPRARKRRYKRAAVAVPGQASPLHQIPLNNGLCRNPGVVRPRDEEDLPSGCALAAPAREIAIRETYLVAAHPSPAH
jgi:hypothetical protein